MSVDNNNDAMRAFARSAISGAVLLNSGAMIAILSQLSALSGLIAAQNIRYAIILWTLGMVIGTICWLLAYLAASAFGQGNQVNEVKFALSAGILIVLSILFFGAGMFVVAIGYQPIPNQLSQTS